MANRSNRREVRNPVLALPSVKRLDELSPEARAIVADILGDLVSDARSRAQQSWAKNKGPMAAYWKAVGAYAHHFRRVVRSPSPQPNMVGALSNSFDSGHGASVCLERDRPSDLTQNEVHSSFIELKFNLADGCVGCERNQALMISLRLPECLQLNDSLHRLSFLQKADQVSIHFETLRSFIGSLIAADETVGDTSPSARMVALDPHTQSLLAAQNNVIDCLMAENEKLRKALAPFAKVADSFDGVPVSAILPQQCWFTPHSLREARAAIATTKGQAKAREEPDPIVCDVVTMQHSSGFPDHFTRVRVGRRELTLFMSKIKGRCEYHAAELNWLLNGAEKPHILDFSDDEPEGFSDYLKSTETGSPSPQPNLTMLLQSKAEGIRTEYQLAHGRPCDCSTPDSALHYGRAQGLEIAADVIGAEPSPQPNLAVSRPGLSRVATTDAAGDGSTSPPVVSSKVDAVIGMDVVAEDPREQRGPNDADNDDSLRHVHDAAPLELIPPHVRNFIGKVQGVCLGVVMSGSEHPNPDGVVMELVDEAQEILFPATTEGSEG